MHVYGIKFYECSYNNKGVCAILEHMPSCFMYMCGYLVLGECPHGYTREFMHVIQRDYLSGCVICVMFV